MVCEVAVRLSQPGPSGPIASVGTLSIARARRVNHVDGTTSWVLLPVNDTALVTLVSAPLVAVTSEVSADWHVSIGETYGTVGVATILAEPTGSSDALIITERILNSPPVVRWLAVPDVDEIGYGALAEIDPETLGPLNVPEAAWWAALDALQPNNQHNRAGQVKLAYVGFSINDAWVPGIAKVLDPSTATSVTIAPSPTTIWPYGSTPQTTEQVYDSTTDRWRENSVQGQVHRWRVNGTYSAKQINNTGQLSLQLTNPDSGFLVDWSMTLPSGLTSGPFTAELITIADPASLGAGLGYVLSAHTSFADADMLLTIGTVTRFSLAVDWPLL